MGKIQYPVKKALNFSLIYTPNRYNLLFYLTFQQRGDQNFLEVSLGGICDPERSTPGNH